MELYQPGLHLLSTFKAPAQYLCDVSACRQIFDSLIEKHELVNVGETYHSFEGGGFTATVCLTESHIAIHTWPEFGHATFDVFLSNYKQNNEAKVRDIYEQVLTMFNGIEIQKQECYR